MSTLTTHQDRRADRAWTPGAMDLDAVAAVFRRNMAALVNERETRRQTRIPPSHVRAA